MAGKHLIKVVGEFFAMNGFYLGIGDRYYVDLLEPPVRKDDGAYLRLHRKPKKKKQQQCQSKTSAN